MIQIIMSFLGAGGFAMVFNVRGKKLFLIGLGGALSWAVYLGWMSVSNNPFTSLILATAAVVAASEILARVLKAPIILMMVPMLIPLIPGGALYYTMSYLVKNDSVMFAEALRDLLMQAGAIAVGIILMTFIMTNFFAIYYRRKCRKK